MERWRKAWREGIAPSLTIAGLRALKTALETDDPRLIQGMTAMRDGVELGSKGVGVAAACAIAYCGWQGEGISDCTGLASYLCRVSDEADRRTGALWIGSFLASSSSFLNWWDDNPRHEVRPALLEEVNLSLAKRTAAA